MSTEKLLEGIGGMVRGEIERQVAQGTFKLKQSNGMLQSNLETLRAELQGKTEEFEGQVQRAREAEGLVEARGKRLAELKITIEALQEKLAELTKEKEEAAAKAGTPSGE